MKQKKKLRLLLFIILSVTLVAACLLVFSSKEEVQKRIAGVPTFKEETTIPLRSDQAMGPLALNFSPNGKFAYVSVPKGSCMCDEPAGEKSVIAKISLTENKLVDEIATDLSVLDVKVTPDGKFLYVCNAYEDVISVYSTDNLQLVTTIAAGPGISTENISYFTKPYTYKPTFLAFSANDRYAAVSMAKGAALGLIDISTHTLIDRIPVVAESEIDSEKPFAWLLWGITAHPTKNLVFVGGKMAGEIFIFDLDQRKMIKKVEVPESGIPMGIGIDPQGEFVYVTDGRNGNVYLLDTQSQRIVDKISFPLEGSTPEWISFDPRGNFAFITHRKLDLISVVDTKTKKQVATLQTESRPFMANVSPDGKYLWVTNREGDNLQIFKIQ